MKRINPLTNKPFCHGEQRVDGYFFKSYGKKILINGFFIEHWHSPKTWEKLKLKKIDYYNKNKEKIKQKQKQYNIDNKENYQKYQKEYSKSNKKKQYFLNYREKNKEIYTLNECMNYTFKDEKFDQFSFVPMLEGRTGTGI